MRESNLATHRIPLGVPRLDELLHGGFRKGDLTMVYGEAATGKTSMMIQAATSAGKIGFKAIYIDSDHSFTYQRFNQISGRDADLVSRRISLFFPETFNQQRLLIESLRNYVTPSLALVIVDSVSSLYRSEFTKAESIFTLNRDLGRQIAYLSELSASSDLACVITSQVHARLKPPVGDIEPVARRALFHFPNTIVRIKNTPRAAVKELVVERIEGTDTTRTSCLAMLQERGFVDMPR